MCTVLFFTLQSNAVGASGSSGVGGGDRDGGGGDRGGGGDGGGGGGDGGGGGGGGGVVLAVRWLRSSARWLWW